MGECRKLILSYQETLPAGEGSKESREKRVSRDRNTQFKLVQVEI